MMVFVKADYMKSHRIGDGKIVVAEIAVDESCKSSDEKKSYQPLGFNTALFQKRNPGYQYTETDQYDKI